MEERFRVDCGGEGAKYYPLGRNPVEFLGGSTGHLGERVSLRHLPHPCTSPEPYDPTLSLSDFS